MTKHAAQPAVRRIFNLPQAVPVFEHRRPRADLTNPTFERVPRTRVARELFAAPAIVIAPNPQHVDTALVQVRKCGQHTISRARHHMLPGKPEIEQITHDHQRAGPVWQPAEQGEQFALGVDRRNAQMGIAKNIARRREHAGSLTPTLDADKRDDHLSEITGMATLHPAAEHSNLRMLHETVSDLRVRYAETDQMGVVYHANYLVWCELGRTDFIRASGKPYAELERDGVRLAVSEASMRCHGSARYDDAIEVHTRLVALGSRAMTFAYRIVAVEREQLLVSASTSLISLSAAGRPTALPPTVRAFLSAVTSTGFEREK